MGHITTILLSLVFIISLSNCSENQTTVGDPDISSNQVSTLSSETTLTELEVIKVGIGDLRPDESSPALEVVRRCLANNDFGKIREVNFYYGFADFPGKQFVELVLDENSVKTLLFVEIPTDNFSFDYLGAQINTNVELNEILSEGQLTTVSYLYDGQPINDGMDCTEN